MYFILIYILTLNTILFGILKLISGIYRSSAQQWKLQFHHRVHQFEIKTLFLHARIFQPLLQSTSCHMLTSPCYACTLQDCQGLITSDGLWGLSCASKADFCLSRASGAGQEPGIPVMDRRGGESRNIRELKKEPRENVSSSSLLLLEAVGQGNWAQVGCFQPRTMTNFHISALSLAKQWKHPG